MTAQPVRKPLDPPLRLVPGKPKQLSIKFEPFYVIARELPQLFRKHWRELGVHKESVPLDPHWDNFFAQSVQGTLHVLTARDPADDKLVGYIFNIVSPHLHYKSTLHAHIDMYWLDPAYRRGLTGLRMFRLNEQQLKKLGVVRLMVSEKLHWKTRNNRQVRVLFKRLGYKASEILFTKLLED